MKINSVQREITLKQGGSRLLSEANNFREKSDMSLCKKNRGYNADYCGSFTGKSEAATNVIKKSFGDKILTSNWFNKFLEIAEEHNISTNALIALILAGVFRPFAIMTLPGKKDMEDKIYAAGHALSSAIVGFVFSVLATSPLDGALSKSINASERLVFAEKRNPGETEESLKKMASKTFVSMFEEIKALDEQIKTLGSKQDKEALKALTTKREAMKTLAKNMPDWLLAVPRACLTIAIIPPILKYVFGLEKKKKSGDKKQQEMNTPQQQFNFIDKPIFQSIKGGVK